MKIIDTNVGIVAGDPDRLQQVLWNLLSNAIKFTPRDGRIHVQLLRVESTARISVRDNGQGVPREMLPVIFDRFRQVERPGGGTHSGLGLGLSIVKSLVELHGGIVAATSAGPGHGAEFTIDLPLAPSADFFGASTSGASVAVRGLLQGTHVLLVEDERDAAEMTQIVLEREGARVSAVHDAASALVRLRDTAFDVIVSDIGLPHTSGYELMQTLRSTQGPCTNIPGVALTAFARSDDRARAFLSGFQAHLAKPIKADELVAVVASLTGRTGRAP